MLDSNKKYFVYKYTFPNNKVYIGKSNIHSHRFGRPKSYSSQMVYRAMEKYPDFSKEILVYCDTEEEAFELEEKYIKIYNSYDPKFGYNNTIGGEGASIPSLYKAVEQYSLSGELLKIYSSINEAAAITGLSDSSIICACSSKYSSRRAGQYQWKYADDDSEIKSIENLYPSFKTVYQISLTGEIIKFYNSVEEAANETKLNKNFILRVCKHERKSYNGYIWCFDNEVQNDKYIGEIIYKKGGIKHNGVKQYDLEGNYIGFFLSTLDAAKKYGLDKSSIIHVCLGDKKIAGGYQWRYGDDDSCVLDLSKTYHYKGPNKNAVKRGDKNA